MQAATYIHVADEDRHKDKSWSHCWGQFWLTYYAVVAIIHVSDDILDMGTTVGHSFGADSASHAIVGNSTPCT